MFIMFIRFDTTHERDRQTDRHRMTAYAALMHSIARQKYKTWVTYKFYKCWLLVYINTK